MATPAIKASWSQGIVALARTNAKWAATLGAPGLADAIHTVQSAPRINWQDFGHYYRIIEALRLAHGNEGLAEFFETYVAGLRHAPLYIPLLQTVDLFGGGPYAVMRLYARGYGLSFRDTGKMTVSPLSDQPGVSMLLEGIPEPCRNIAFLFAHLGGMRGGFRLGGSVARVEFDSSGLREGSIFFEAFEQAVERTG